MKTTIIAAILLLFGTQAEAVSTNFSIFFDENNGEPFQHADWSGMYMITDGKLTAFSALIGTCADLLKCTWTTWTRQLRLTPVSQASLAELSFCTTATRG